MKTVEKIDAASDNTKCMKDSEMESDMGYFFPKYLAPLIVTIFLAWC